MFYVLIVSFYLMTPSSLDTSGALYWLFAVYLFYYDSVCDAAPHWTCTTGMGQSKYLSIYRFYYFSLAIVVRLDFQAGSKINLRTAINCSFFKPSADKKIMITCLRMVVAILPTAALPNLIILVRPLSQNGAVPILSFVWYSSIRHDLKQLLRYRDISIELRFYILFGQCVYNKVFKSA